MREREGGNEEMRRLGKMATQRGGEEEKWAREEEKGKKREKKN